MSTRPIVHASFMGGAALALLSLGGCDTPRPADAGPLGLSSSRAATESLAGASIYPAEAGTTTFAIVAGDDHGDALRHERSETTDHGAQWKEVVSLVDASTGETAPRRTNFWTVNDEGDIVMPAAINHGDRALTLFDPPMLIAPAELTPGEPVTVEVDMRVVDSRNHGNQKEAGNATRTIELIDRVKLHFEDGRRFDAYRVRITFNADLRMANAEDTIELFIVPDQGIVAQTRSESVTTLGMVLRATERTLILSED